MADQSVGIESPRLLRLTFEISVPQGLRRNVQFKRVEKAAAHITGVVQAAVASSFPWASGMKVRTEWSYAWADWTEDVALPVTDDNTVVREE